MNKLSAMILIGIIGYSVVSCKENNPFDDIDYSNASKYYSVSLGVPSISYDRIKGIAADGATVLELAIPYNEKYEIQKFSITPVTESWGKISKSADTEGVYELIDTSPTVTDGYYYYYFTAEESLPSALETDSVATLEYEVSIMINDKEMSLVREIEVVRSPAIFAHGLASDASTFDPMLSYIKPKGLYIEPALYALDYGSTATASYDTNTDVVPNALEYTFNNMLDRGYKSTKATLIGHSMGGILTRLYMQGDGYQDDILKVITIDTPHSGSQLADFGVDLGERYPNSPLAIFGKIGAIIDLQVDSDATLIDLNGDNLNSVTLPSHALCATIGTTLNVASLVAEKQYLNAFIAYLLNLLTDTYIYGESNDIVVPLSSQNGGLANRYLTSYNDQWHCSVHTTESAADDILELLATLSSNKLTFATDGFDPELLTYTSSSPSETSMDKVSIFSDDIQVASCMSFGLDANDEIIEMQYTDSDDLTSVKLESSDMIKRVLYLAKSKVDGSIIYDFSE